MKKIIVSLIVFCGFIAKTDAADDALMEAPSAKRFYGIASEQTIEITRRFVVNVDYERVAPNFFGWHIPILPTTPEVYTGAHELMLTITRGMRTEALLHEISERLKRPLNGLRLTYAGREQLAILDVDLFDDANYSDEAIYIH